MDTRSPNCRNGVRGAPCSSCSSVRFSARQLAAAAAVVVRHRARADDGAGAEPARLRHVRDELREAERHVDAGVGLAEVLRR